MYRGVDYPPHMDIIGQSVLEHEASTVHCVLSGKVLCIRNAILRMFQTFGTMCLEDMAEGSPMYNLVLCCC